MTAAENGNWYMVTHDGAATLCVDEADAQEEAKKADREWPRNGPHRAVQLVEASTAGFTAADMATASAQGFRDGAASLAANAGEPTCDMRTVVAVAVTMLYDTHPEDVCRVFDRNDLETIVSITEPLGHGRVEDIYRDAWDHVAAPPTAQAEGWRPIENAESEPVYQARYQKGFWQDSSRERCEYLQNPENTCAEDWETRILYTRPPTSAEGVEP